MSTFNQIKDVLLETLFPSDGHCTFCKKLLLFENAPLCHTCMEKIPWIGEVICQKCGKEEVTSQTGLCHDCTISDHYFEQGTSLFTYTLQGKKIIHEIKYEGNRKLAKWVGKKIGNRVKDMQWGENIDYIIPVALHPNRLEERGFNQSEELGKGVTAVLNIPLVNDLLIRIKDTPHQTNLTKWERQENISDAFKVESRQKIQGKTALLVDDVYTTGATMNACAEILRKAGAQRIYFAAAAAGKSR